MIRKASVAGQFYPDDAILAEKALDRCFRLAIKKQKNEPSITPIALVCPHAGWVYSGAVAASAWERVPDSLEIDILVMIGPNHTGSGQPISISDAESWETPFGPVNVAFEEARQLSDLMQYCSVEPFAHLREHCLEVILPFAIRKLAPGFEILPILIGMPPTHDTYEICKDLGQKIAEVTKGKRTLIVASTDMSHYVSEKAAHEMDQMAINPLLKLDAETMVSTVGREKITMCGVMPTAAVLEASKVIGAIQAELVDYRNSGQVTGDLSQVVAYAAFAIY